MDRWRPMARNVAARLSPLRPVPGLLWRVPGLLWRMPAQAKAGVAGVAVVLMVIGSVLFVRNPAGPFGRIEALPANAATLTRIPVLGPCHRYLFFPASGPLTAALNYGSVLLTHCVFHYPTGPEFHGCFW